jgi:hypothetical protein
VTGIRQPRSLPSAEDTAIADTESETEETYANSVESEEDIESGETEDEAADDDVSVDDGAYFIHYGPGWGHLA